MMRYSVIGDWGTSRLRLFRIEADKVVDRREGPGIAALPAPPEEVLRQALAAWRGDGAPKAIRLCGMVGSRNGWIEVPYADCPADARTWRAGAASAMLDDDVVTILPGLACSDAAGVPDVMRGEETQIFGAVALDPALGRGRHVLVLPGTHSKWVVVEDGHIVTFRTFLTGELFALLSDHSTLTRAGNGEGSDADEAHGFAHGLARADSAILLGALFEARSAQLRADRSPAWARGFLSGLIIGREIGEALDLFAPQDRVSLIGDPILVERYDQAMARRGLIANLLDGDRCALAGLTLSEQDS
ncbi:MAG: 2-dehydro-3-deoxygalactonokinase [Sphingomonas bacterium]|uniref:2-dehydro-3-deoxygalactonokinase n=1 Tax=Sphingomonas bacterium TaxID=1895847 RepID=UPI00262F2C91|nr:2-dehydro-3-deoxygalactonokinase [Sphingomonas bacterium]MDB5705999.1 2-dehydro-3-deoxygalactonokinase [Sphingomonas bacterium]